MKPIVKVLNGLVEGDDTEWVEDPEKPGVFVLQKKEKTE